MRRRTDSDSSDSTRAVRLSDVAPGGAGHLVDPYLPVGALTLLEGDPAAGKSFVAADLGAATTTGRQPALEVAGSLRKARRPRNVLYLTTEDTPETLRERFAAQDADLTRVMVVPDALSIHDLAPLERLLARHRPALVVVDPIHALLDRVNMASANGVRVALAPLLRLAAKHDLALLGVRHLAKAGAGRAIYRGLGSIDFSAVARSVVRIGEDPDRPGSRVLVHVKRSHGTLGPSVEFEIADGLTWLGRSELTSADLDARPRKARGRSAIEVAQDFILDALRGGPRPAADLRRAAARAGVAERTLERAQKELGVVHLRINEPGRRNSGAWTWQLPPGTDRAATP